MQENSTDSIAKPELPTPRKIIILGHLNIDSLQNKFESIADGIQGTFDICVLSETKIDESFSDKQFCLNNIGYFEKTETSMGEGSCFMRTNLNYRN